LERTGQGQRGSISAIYTVLVEGGDMDEPIADEVRGILDGHIVLDRAIAARGQYPAIDVTVSLSRVMEAVATDTHCRAARKLRELVAAYEERRDLVALGAYAQGSDERTDRAIRALPEIERFLRQDAATSTPLEQTIAELARIAERY
jgi:flagellar biosynthesis/type III secretory pathway ATPase